eukprot:m.11974 g.11974  ORF g.11974 m.11974 type:complete len:264 (+) comp9890_c0_seq4:300-1091(+)
MALCYLRLLITCLLSLALATAVELGDEPQLAAHLHEQCVNDHGEIYKVVPANSGFIFTPIEGVHVGVKLVRSSVGGGCKADMYQACSVLNDDNCRPVVNCTDPSNQQTCMNCQPGRFQKVFKAQVTMYADCENGEVSMRSAPEVQQMEVLRAVKDAIVNDCELKGCRYATESLGNVRLRRRNKGTRFQFPARTKRVCLPIPARHRDRSVTCCTVSTQVRSVRHSETRHRNHIWLSRVQCPSAQTTTQTDRKHSKSSTWKTCVS